MNLANNREGSHIVPILKCKICGGSLNITEGQDICTCEYCGTKQTLPKLDNERKLNLYERASYLRRSNDFDKASVLYEQILSEDKTDAEAYWSLVLCKYGVEYIEDPSAHKMIPTVNRTQYTSIFNDEDYKQAIDNASIEQKIIYEEEAKKIDDIQKRILAVSQKEEPFDIFICYKETDEQGRRTKDSVLAYDIYNSLTKEGYKVFFSRVTLEDKMGIAYEPYIFAALNSAKIMIVVGSKKEYFEAVWVKNEWSRYLSMIRKGEDKVLIPAYTDMDPYDLPEEFAYLQAQDMSRLGFLQDLIRGIDKILGNSSQSKQSKPDNSNKTRPVPSTKNDETSNKKRNRLIVVFAAVFVAAALLLYFLSNRNTKSDSSNEINYVDYGSQEEYTVNNYYKIDDDSENFTIIDYKVKEETEGKIKYHIVINSKVSGYGVCIFNASDGDLLKYYLQNTVKGKNTYEFEVNKDILNTMIKRRSELMLTIYNGGTPGYFVILEGNYN